LESAMTLHAPDVFAALQPGLTDDQIDEVESRHLLRLTEDLRSLYRWRNGSPVDSQAELIPGYWFVPLESAAQLREKHKEDVSQAELVQKLAYFIFAGHRTGWLTVLADRCGDGYFYDPARRRRSGNFFFYFAEDGQYRYFPSLANFICGATECYNAGVYRPDRRGADREDFERSLELWQRYAACRAG
jgi:hypothetical protein